MRAVNLIPGEQRSGGSVGAGRSEGAAYALLAMLVAVALLAVLYGKASRNVSSEKAKAATVTAEAAAANQRAEALGPYTSFAALREQRQNAVESIVDTRFDWAHAFHELGRVIGPQTTITSLTGTVGSAAGGSGSAAAAKAAGGSATPSGSVPLFTLAGCATSQRAVAETLQRLRLMDGVAEVTLQSSTKAGSGSGGGGAAAGSSGGCPAADPLFSMTVQFDPLPSASQSAAAATGKGARTVSDTGAAATGGN